MGPPDLKTLGSRVKVSFANHNESIVAFWHSKCALFELDVSISVLVVPACTQAELAVFRFAVLPLFGGTVAAENCTNAMVSEWRLASDGDEAQDISLEDGRFSVTVDSGTIFLTKPGVAKFSLGK
jgi:hypothetical protein